MKEQEPIKIEIEDVAAADEASDEGNQPQASRVNIEEELRKFGQQLTDTIQAALNSEEVKKVQSDMQAGMQKFADEMGKAFNNAKDSETGQKVSQRVNEIDSSEVAQSFKKGVSQGLAWLSQELGKLSDAIAVDSAPAAESTDETTKEKEPEITEL